MSELLVEAIVEMQEEEALALARDMVARGASSEEILALCREAMGEVGRRFEAGNYFLPELMMAGELLREVAGIVKAEIGGVKAAETLGDVVLGTVRGDIHDIGKDIVGFMLEVNSFRVHDLGVDVPPARFVEVLQETGASVLALSGLLTLAFDAMKDTVSAVEAAGLRGRVKVMIGGGAMDQKVADFSHADAFGVDAMAAVTLARRWILGEQP